MIDFVKKTSKNARILLEKTKKKVETCPFINLIALIM